MWNLFSRKSTLVSESDALPGRGERPFDVSPLHTVNGNSLTEVPDGHEVMYFALGCFWGAERLFWTIDGVFSTAVGYQGGFTSHPTYKEVCSGGDRPHRERSGGVRPFGYGDGGVVEDVLGGARPDPGHASGQRRGHAVPQRHLHDYRRAGCYGFGVSCGLSGGSGGSRDHHGARGGLDLLLRRGRPPAVFSEEPRRLLWDWGDGGELSSRPWRERLGAKNSGWKRLDHRRTSQGAGRSPIQAAETMPLTSLSEPGPWSRRPRWLGCTRVSVGRRSGCPGRKSDAPKFRSHRGR